MVKLLVFGDSITWGAFDTEKGGWVERLKIFEFDKGTSVYNLGISSDDTNGVLFRLENAILAINKIEPEEIIILFSIGSNDARYVLNKETKFVPINTFEKNLKQITKIAKQHSTRVVFTGLLAVDESKTTPIAWNPTEFYENDDLKEYDLVIQKVCDSLDVKFIPLFELLSAKDLSDGVHPNALGHEKIFKAVKEFFEGC